MLLVACLGRGGSVFVLIGQLSSHGDGTCEVEAGWVGEQCLSDTS